MPTQGASSTIWAQLANPNQASGGIPYVGPDNATIYLDVADFFYDQANSRLFITNGISVNLVDKSATPGACTINRSAGRFAVAAGASSVVISNNLVTAGDVIITARETLDATLTTIKVVAGAGIITVTGNANATAITVFSFVLVKAVLVAA